jgi:hypothetical protein
MRLRPRFGIDINLIDDYGDIYVGPLEISWCNQACYEPGSFGLDWGNKWHLYMTYYESCDPFTGTQDGWPGFVDWELCVYNDSVDDKQCYSPMVAWYNLKKWISNHLHRS